METMMMTTENLATPMTRFIIPYFWLTIGICFNLVTTSEILTEFFKRKPHVAHFRYIFLLDSSLKLVNTLVTIWTIFYLGTATDQ